MALLVIRIIPIDSSRAADFTNALVGLKIEAFELSVTNPDGTSVAFGSAIYLPPTLPPSPGSNPTPNQDPDTRIVQHFRIDLGNITDPNDQRLIFFSVATAVIEIPPGPEYKNADVMLKISRSTGEVIHRQKYYNVPVEPGSMPSPGTLPLLKTTSLHLQLPASGQMLNPADAFIDIPADGTPPNFDEIKEAIGKVLALDPGGVVPAISSLTPKQCRHIAYEIVWNTDIYPLPSRPIFTGGLDIPLTSLEAMYTTGEPITEDADKEEQERKKFEGSLLAYYTIHNVEAQFLSGYVYSVAAALKCEEISSKALEVGFSFFTRPDLPANTAAVREITVTLKNKSAGLPIAPSFKVDACFFYALGASLTLQSTAEQRYKMATLGPEQQLVDAIDRAAENGVITFAGTINQYQAVRRLIALGSRSTFSGPECSVAAGDPIHTFIVAWQGFAGEKIIDFWSAWAGWPNALKEGHFELVLCAITTDSSALKAAIRAMPATNLTMLAAKAAVQWKALFIANPSLLPDFTKPGTTDERIEAFMRFLRRYFIVAAGFDSSPIPQTEPAPVLGRPPNMVDAVVAAYGPSFTFDGWTDALLNPALATVLPGDEETQKLLNGLLSCIKGMMLLTVGLPSTELQFSVIEALWARGFTNASLIRKLSAEEFLEALSGSVAYDYATTIWTNAGATGAPTPPKAGTFTSVNPDGKLINCIPPLHLSPLGPVAYLKELLAVSADSTCRDPNTSSRQSVGFLLATRRGDLSSLLVTEANLSVLIPMMDIVNESLEFMVANGASHGAVYNTSSSNIAEHELTSKLGHGPSAHDPETLLEALPEHSTPRTPVKEPNAYKVLEGDFSTPVLPYSQALDINCSYLRRMKTCRYEAVRRFRKNITEFVLDPAKETPEFQKHLWRYPVRLDAAISYFCLSLKELDFFTGTTTRTRGRTTATVSIDIKLPTYYGYVTEEIQQPDGTKKDWKEVVVRVPEFLKRTDLSYCEFIQLWRSGYVKFHNRKKEISFAECEPCCLDEYVIEFDNPPSPAQALYQLLVFIRLWRKLKSNPRTTYSFEQLADICSVLNLFSAGKINPDFLRQLLAFQMLLDDFELSLVDGSSVAVGATGADRLHLLAFWVPGSSRFEWAVQHLLNQIQQYAQKTHGCREPEFIKILRTNLSPLSKLAGFESDTNAANAHWHQQPTKTLRFAEILSKIYTSDFTIGELFFMFMADPNLQGDDPFPSQTDNEAKDSPFGSPDDEDPFTLWALRKKILDVEASEDESKEWTWLKIEATLHKEFGYMPSASDPLRSIGKHFFPGILVESGIPVLAGESQYRTALINSSPPMWNTPAGPFHYDAAPVNELSMQIPLSDEAVIAKLSRIRQLNANEQKAVQNLYFMPRVDLGRFSFLFTNFKDAEEALIQEADERIRWVWFQEQFVFFYKRCQVIAEHLAQHILFKKETKNDSAEIISAAKLILKSLWADENKALSSWENDNGEIPPNPPGTQWQPQPNGGAFAALLGLGGTGMRVNYSVNAMQRWEEVRGGVGAFGPEENAYNIPIPTILPALNFSFPVSQQALLRFVILRNGFALSNPGGLILGGAEPFSIQWEGLLLIEQEGQYAFMAGGNTPDGELPDFTRAAHFHNWVVRLERGQRSWTLLNNNWPNEEAPADCSKPIHLRKGIYKFSIDLKHLPLDFDDAEDVEPQTTGFQVKYKGPDSNQQPIQIPFNKLFLSHKEGRLGEAVAIDGSANDFLNVHYTSTVRDIRRTYQRCYKALLFAHRMKLSTTATADDGQSEFEYILANPINFSGQSYYRSGSSFITHKANFDFNFMPVLDNYYEPTLADDNRVKPSSQRSQAMFDWWERLFDYSILREETYNSPERPLWLLFHESKEAHPDIPAALSRYMGVDFTHEQIVQKFHFGYTLTSADLADDRWSVRVWKAEQWIRRLLHNFAASDITIGRPDLWTSSDPNFIESGESVSGNQNLTQFYRTGMIENKEPRRYENVKKLNDELREKGHKALVSYLCAMNRVALPWGGFVTNAKQLSEVLLMDVDAGLCQKASRIEEAIITIHIFIQRARLGIEPGFIITPAFLLMWKEHFETLQIWESCKRREIYRENWIEWDEMAIAEQSETYQFLKSELRNATLTMPIPAGLTYWSGARPPMHPGLMLLQHRKASIIELLNPVPEGLGLMGTEDRHSRPNWLAPMKGAGLKRKPDDPGHPNDPYNNPANPRDNDPHRPISNERAILNPQSPSAPNKDLPMWLQAAVRLGTKFIRVAAAGIPPATTTMRANCERNEQVACCEDCDAIPATLMDEYYFWIEDSDYYHGPEQIADWGATAKDQQTDWRREDKLQGLLYWKADKMVHLKWSKVHNREFQQLRQSYEGVLIDKSIFLPAWQHELVFTGREGDSLYFEFKRGKAPIGYPMPLPRPGFRYDIATDEAIVLPEIAPPAILPPAFSGLSAFPYFAWYTPGAPLLPLSMYSTALTVARHLQTHCQFEGALRWYELTYNPLVSDNSWVICSRSITTRYHPVINDCCCSSAPVSDQEAKDRSVLLHYLETLIKYGDALMQKNSLFSIQKADVIFEEAAKILGAVPATVDSSDATEDGMTINKFIPVCAPLNARLLCIYTAVQDRLSLIHHCVNSKRFKHGEPAKDMPFFGNSLIHSCWKIADHTCLDEGDWCVPQSHYRFTVLIQQALNAAELLRSSGASLLAAYEKGDSEYLGNLRAMHESQLMHLGLNVRQNQWRDADWQVQALQKTKEIAQTNLQYYNGLISVGLIGLENAYLAEIGVSQIAYITSQTLEITAQAMNATPDIWVGTVGPLPTILQQLPIGSKLGGVFSAASRVSTGLASEFATLAAQHLTEAGWERRLQEWQHQVEVLTIEIQQIERQILAAERRRDVALRELNSHAQQFENSRELQNFLRDKFTNHALYLWLQQETASLYSQFYELALRNARQAERAFNFERGHVTHSFLPTNVWDNLHEGLLSGERLQLALKQMEKLYFDQNVREYELTKHISLRIHSPKQLLMLRETGYCDVELPEWLFDLDYPGHYMRRIKNVTISLPCVAGPYTTVNCRLILLSSRTRVDPRLNVNVKECCEDSRCQNDYAALPDDPRIIVQYAATEAIATSTGQNDSGMFELNFRDERYLPFEYAGVVSRWRIELPKENNYFDLNSLSDVILHVHYTAREGGELLRTAANHAAQKHLPGDGVQFFDVRQEMPDAWYLFQNNDARYKKMLLRLGRQMFPYLPNSRQVWLNDLQVFIMLNNETSKDSITVQFSIDAKLGSRVIDENDGDIFEIHCVRSSVMPQLFHGVLQDSINFKIGPLSNEIDTVGQLIFPDKCGKFEQVVLSLGYTSAAKEAK